MKKKKIFLGLAIASAALFSLAACNAPTQSSTSVPGSASVQPSVEKVTVTFNTNGGSTVAAAEVEKGGKVTKPANPTKASDANNDYVFLTWCKDADLTTEFDFEKETISAATTVYAKFAAVSKDTAIKMNGTAYDTIAAALAAVPADSEETYTITLPKGTYTENGLGYNGKATIIIKGNTATKYGADVIIKGHGNDMSTEKGRNLIEIQGSGDIILENLTLESDWTRTLAGGNNAQAEVLGTDTKGNTVAYNCSFKSHQDTLRTAGKAWFYGCYIEGDVDFIWMEQAGSVALYENCEIVSVYDATPGVSHSSYIGAPRMAKSMKAGKGLVIFNSTIKESAEAKENGQQTYLARNPWSNVTDYFNQVAFINTNCSDIEAKLWYNAATVTDFDKTQIGFKLDKATAKSLNYEGTDDVLTDTQVAKEYSGRETILNRVFNTGKIKFEKDSANYWDIKSLISTFNFLVTVDESKSVLDGETEVEPTVYEFDGSVDQSALCNGFALQSGKPHYVGQNGATITIPVTGKSYVEVYGYYSGTVEAKAGSQGEQVMFFNNNSTSSQVENDYIVYDATATNVVITAKATTYITKIVVIADASIEDAKVTSIDITASTTNYSVGVPLRLTAKANPGTAVNKSIKWSSSDTAIATIDEYTGKVTFIAAGEVTFTAAATDGSEVTKTFTCTAKEPKWTVAEWYTTDSDVTGEEAPEGKTGPTEIGAYDTGKSAYKDLKINGTSTTFTFTNVSGEEISTSKGLKLNSTGSLAIATTKGAAHLTVVTVQNINAYAVPKVSDGTTNLEPEETITDTAKGITTFKYFIPSNGVWTIMRGDDTKECNPILYAKCEYETRLTKSTFVNYKGGTYHATSGSVSYNHNNENSGIMLDKTGAKVTYDLITYEGCKNNGADNWLALGANATITFKTAGKATLNIYFYNGQNMVTVKLNGTEVTTATATQTTHAVPYVYELNAEGEVVITATSSGYIGCFELLYPATDIKTDTSLVFHGNGTGMTNVVKWANNTVVGNQDGFTISGSNFSNSGYLEFKNDDKVEFDVVVESGKKAVISISSYYDKAVTAKVGETDLTLTKDATNSSSENYIYTTEVTASGKIAISATAEQNYLNWITITFVNA